MYTIYYKLFLFLSYKLLNAIHGMIFKFYWVYEGCIGVGDLGKQPPIITGVGISAGDLGKQPPITGVGILMLS